MCVCVCDASRAYRVYYTPAAPNLKLFIIIGNSKVVFFARYVTHPSVCIYNVKPKIEQLQRIPKKTIKKFMLNQIFQVQLKKVAHCRAMRYFRSTTQMIQRDNKIIKITTISRK